MLLTLGFMEFSNLKALCCGAGAEWCKMRE